MINEGRVVAEVVAIGTELLLGQIVDTNSAWMGDQLALAGVENYIQVKVGDNHDRMVAMLRESLSRSDAVICCGGLGPTQDDITRKAIAEVMGVELVRDDAIAERIEAMFTSRGREMPQNNLLQADIPAGAHAIAQQPGTAPGLVCPIGEDKVIYAVPGVPSEMREMVLGTVIPELQARVGAVSAIVSRTLRTWGQSESGLAEMLDDRMTELDETGNPTLAFNASGIEGIKVRITAKAPTEAEADVLIDQEEATLRGILGPIVFGVDETTMEASVLKLCIEQGLTIAVAESATGGLATTRMTAAVDLLGTEAEVAFRGGITVADGASAIQAGFVGEGAVDEGRLVGPLAAAALAEAVVARTGADVGVASTAVLDATDEARGQGSVGTVHVAVVRPGADTEIAELRLPGDRIRLRQYATIGSLDLVRRRLTDAG